MTTATTNEKLYCNSELCRETSPAPHFHDHNGARVDYPNEQTRAEYRERFGEPTQEQQPTPRPWRIERSKPNVHEELQGPFLDIVSGDELSGMTVARWQFGTHRPDGLIVQDMINAALIVTAVNAHDKLVEALKGVSIMLNTELEKYESEPWAQRVREALKLAEAESKSDYLRRMSDTGA